MNSDRFKSYSCSTELRILNLVNLANPLICKYYFITMRILITGSAGFIGSAICHSLVKLGHEIQSVDNFSNYYDVSLKYARVEALLEPLGLKVIDLDLSLIHI